MYDEPEHTREDPPLGLRALAVGVTLLLVPVCVMWLSMVVSYYDDGDGKIGESSTEVALTTGPAAVALLAFAIAAIRAWSVSGRGRVANVVASLVVVGLLCFAASVVAVFAYF